MRLIISKFRDQFLKILNIREHNFRENNPTIKEAFISITFDDAYESIYTHAFPLMRELGFKGVVFIIGGLINGYFEGHKTMHKKQLYELFNNGWEMGSHTYSHANLSALKTFTQSQSFPEITLNKLKLEEMGFDIISFAYPFGFFSNPKIIEEVKKSYKYARTTNQGINGVCKSSLFLKSVSFKNNNLPYVKKWIDKVIDKGGWLIINCHGIVQDEAALPPKIYEWSHLTEFTRLLYYIKKKEIRVVTFKDINQSFK